MSAVTDKLTELGIEPDNGEAFTPLTEGEIARVEATVDGQLPDQYKRFLMTYGRSRFSVEVNCTPKAEPLYFGSFFGLSELLVAVDGLRETLPETIIPIAGDEGGNAFCLGVTGRDQGKVYFHHHSIGWRADAEKHMRRGELVPADIRYQTVHLIANSFDEFILQMAMVEDE